MHCLFVTKRLISAYFKYRIFSICDLSLLTLIRYLYGGYYDVCDPKVFSKNCASCDFVTFMTRALCDGVICDVTIMTYNSFDILTTMVSSHVGLLHGGQKSTWLITTVNFWFHHQLSATYKICDCDKMLQKCDGLSLMLYVQLKNIIQKKKTYEFGKM